MSFEGQLNILFGKAVKIRRMKKGWSIEKLSEKSDVSVNTISKIERGNVNPKLTTIYKLANGLNLKHPEELLTEATLELYDDMPKID
ncbi:helix-turn-helix domain-containing protein [Halalkalibacter lacteus]|uniref:helix-turn-helix domain-containing protein n=1 Tax=Halalkalibacter lacteus TaxID=3090663 RepID=UPI002FC6E415